MGAILMPRAGRERFRFARLEIAEQLRTTGAAASYAGLSQFNVWANGAGILPTAAMSNATTPAPFVASASTEAASREAWRAFAGAGAAAGSGWLATAATGWIDLDMGTPRDVVAFSLGASHDGTAFTYPTKWRLVLHNGAPAAGRVVYDNIAGSLAWTNARQNRATILSEAAAGRLGGWTTIQNCLYVSATHQSVARNGFLRIDCSPQAGTALVTDQMRVYDGASWIAGAMANVLPNAPLGYQACGTLESQIAALAWNAAPTAGWYVANTGGEVQTNFIVLPTDPVAVRGLEITCPASGYTRAPGSFAVSAWNGNGWTQRGSASGITWSSGRQVQQFTW